MLRVIVTCLALLAGAGAAQAQSVVQFSNNIFAINGGFVGFDSGLGSLDRVTFAISSTENRYAFGHVGQWPNEAPDAVNLTWTIDGPSNFNLYSLGPNSTLIGAFAVPIHGAGSQVLTSDPATRGIYMQATGSAVFDIDPLLIPQMTASCCDLWTYFGGGGFYDGSDLSLVTDYQPLDTRFYGGYCDSGRFGQEACNFFHYTLTYFYTSSAGAVPEPQTWAMMLLGFGAIGFSMRRSRAARGCSPAEVSG